MWPCRVRPEPRGGCGRRRDPVITTGSFAEGEPWSPPAAPFQPPAGRWGAEAEGALCASEAWSRSGSSGRRLACRVRDWAPQRLQRRVPVPLGVETGRAWCPPPAANSGGGGGAPGLVCARSAQLFGTQVLGLIMRLCAVVTATQSKTCNICVIPESSLLPLSSLSLVPLSPTKQLLSAFSSVGGFCLFWALT